MSNYHKKRGHRKTHSIIHEGRFEKQYIFNSNFGLYFNRQKKYKIQSKNIIMSCESDAKMHLDAQNIKQFWYRASAIEFLSIAHVHLTARSHTNSSTHIWEPEHWRSSTHSRLTLISWPRSHWLVFSYVFGDISEGNNDYSDALDFGKGWLGEVRVVTFFCFGGPWLGIHNVNIHGWGRDFRDFSLPKKNIFYLLENTAINYNTRI